MRTPEESDAERLDELLDVWESGCRHGNEPSVEELCVDRPDLARELGRRVAQLRAWNDFQRRFLLGGGLTEEPGSRPPKQLDRYVILEKVGEGGMGVVYRALHAAMGRQVALKALPTGAVDSSEKIRRFRREARAVGRLSHPNIVAAFDAGEADGVHFLVMEFIEGEDLGRLVDRRGPLPVDEAVAMLVQAARGLDYAHRAGVVHRDVKPRNLIRATDGTVKVLDLGLARIRSEMTADDDMLSPDVTTVGYFFGTACYASPEQAAGDQQVDHRADIYSLGCTLHYLLIGRPPYKARSVMQTLLAHREGPIPSLSALRPEVPAVLDAVFRRMVAKEPGDRYQSMGQVMAALDAPATTREEDGNGEGMEALASGRSEADAKPNSRREPRLTTYFVIAGAAVMLAGALLRSRTHSGAGVPSRRVSEVVSARPRLLSQVVDLDRSTALVVDEFDDPKRSAFGWQGHARKFKEGRMILPAGSKDCWGSDGYRFDDFVCELVARVAGGRHEGWGLDLSRRFFPDTPAAFHRGVQVTLNDRGELFVLPSRWAEEPAEEVAPIGPIPATAFRPGQFNSLTVMLSRGDELSVFVNGVEVGDPVRLPHRISPTIPLITSRGGSAGARLEFESFKVWSRDEREAAPRDAAAAAGGGRSREEGR